MRELNREDLMNILLGCAILGTGGGGSLEEGIRCIDEALTAGKHFRLVNIDELDPEAVIGTPYACGAISPLTEEEKKKYARLRETEESMYLLNMKQLERFLGRKVSAVVSTELGGGNTATAFYVGAMTDIPIVDADPAGRSVPALQHSTYYLKGVPMCPMAVMNEFGEIVGFEYLRAIHLNDSKKDLATHVDRHENIGKGFMGKELFRQMMRDPRLDNMPIVLETPDESLWADEIKMLKEWAEEI